MPIYKNLARIILLSAFCAASLLAVSTPIQAQSSLNLRMDPPDLSQFPKITLYIEAYDSQEKFITGMDLDNFSIFEDGYQRTVNESPGIGTRLHTILALNLGATLSNPRHTTIPTRYEETIYTIATWLNTHPKHGSQPIQFDQQRRYLVEKSQEKTSFTNTLQNYNPTCSISNRAWPA